MVKIFSSNLKAFHRKVASRTVGDKAVHCTIAYLPHHSFCHCQLLTHHLELSCRLVNMAASIESPTKRRPGKSSDNSLMVNLSLLNHLINSNKGFINDRLASLPIFIMNVSSVILKFSTSFSHETITHVVWSFPRILGPFCDEFLLHCSLMSEQNKWRFTIRTWWENQWTWPCLQPYSSTPQLMC